MTDNKDIITILSRCSIKPGHEENFIDLWQKEVVLRQHYGFVMINAFIETDAGMQINLLTKNYAKTEGDKIFTSLYSCIGDYESIESNLNKDDKMILLKTEKLDHIAHVETLRPVNQIVFLPPNVANSRKMVIMRQYKIINDWNEFLDIWWKIVRVRENHGFPCLFAVENVEERVFTWAFTYDGDNFDTFMSEGQKGYYSDPQRVELEAVNYYLEEIRLTPARQLLGI